MKKPIPLSSLSIVIVSCFSLMWLIILNASELLYIFLHEHIGVNANGVPGIDSSNIHVNRCMVLYSELTHHIQILQPLLKS